MRMCGPNLECEELAAVFQRHLQEGHDLHFGEFLNTTCKHLVRGGARQGRAGRGDRACLTASLQMRHFPDLLGRLLSTSLFYYKSSWEDVRAAAPMLTGEAAPGSPHTDLAPDLGPTPGPQAPSLAPDCGPTLTGFLVLHMEAEQRPQVDLEQLLTGEPQSCQPRPTQPGAQRAPAPPTCWAALTLWAPGGTK